MDDSGVRTVRARRTRRRWDCHRIHTGAILSGNRATVIAISSAGYLAYFRRSIARSVVDFNFGFSTRSSVTTRSSVVVVRTGERNGSETHFDWKIHHANVCVRYVFDRSKNVLPNTRTFND